MRRLLGDSGPAGLKAYALDTTFYARVRFNLTPMRFIRVVANLKKNATPASGVALFRSKLSKTHFCRLGSGGFVLFINNSSQLCRFSLCDVFWMILGPPDSKHSGGSLLGWFFFGGCRSRTRARAHPKLGLCELAICLRYTYPRCEKSDSSLRRS